MSNYKKAYQQAEKELEKEVVEEIKEMVKSTLQAIESKKAEIAKLNRELKVFKADLEDLKQGKLDKIKERQEKDKLAKQISQVDLKQLGEKAPQLMPLIGSSDLRDFNEYRNAVSTVGSAVVGTYTVTSGTLGETTVYIQ